MHDGADADIIVALFDFADKSLLGRKIKHGAGNSEIVGNRVNTVGIIGSADRVDTLIFGQLIMKEIENGLLAGIHIIDREGFENG